MGTIYDQVGNYPSFQDVQSQVLANSSNKLQQMLLQHQISQFPLQDQLMQGQVAMNQIGLQKANALVHLLTTPEGMQQGAPGTDAMAVGAAAAPSQNGENMGGVGPTLGNAQRMSAPQPPGVTGHTTSGAPLYMGHTAETWGNIKALGGPDQADFIKLLSQGVVAPPGSEVTDLRTGQKHTVITLDQGMRLNDDGSVGYAPNYVESKSGLAGATRQQETAGANRETLLPLGFNAVGPPGQPPRPIGGSVNDFLHPPSAQVAPQPTPGAAPAGPMPIDALPQGPATTDGRTLTGSRDAALMDMAARGQPLNTMKVNGQPAFADLQGALDQAKQGGPEGLARFQAAQLPRILAIPDPAARQRAIAGFTADLQTPAGTPIHSMGGSMAPMPTGGSAPTPTGGSMAPMPTGGVATAGGRPVLAGPADLAGAEVTAKNVAALQTQPQLDAAVTSSKALSESDQKYADALNSKVTEGQSLKLRNNEILRQIDDYQTGVSGSDSRTKLASNLVNMFPGNSTISSIAEKVNGGSVASAQTLHNLVAGAMITNAIKVLDGQGRLNKAEVTEFSKAAESPQTDPGALRRIIAIQARFADQDFSEQQARANRQRANTYNPLTWQADYAAERNQGMSTPGSVYTPATPAPSTGAPTFRYIGKVQ